MFETLLIPTAIPHRCSLGSFIGLHFNLFFFFSPFFFSSSSHTSFILSTSLFSHPPSSFANSFPVFKKLLIALWSTPPQPLCFNLLQAKLVLTPVYKPVALIGHCSSRGVVAGTTCLSRDWPLLTVATFRFREIHAAEAGRVPLNISWEFASLDNVQLSVTG